MDAKWEWHIQGKCLSVAWQTGRQQELEREREEGEKTINKGKWANKKKRKMANSIREWERRAKKEKIICACTLEIKMTKQGLQLPIHAYTPQNIPVTFSVKQVDRRGSISFHFSIHGCAWSDYHLEMKMDSSHRKTLLCGQWLLCNLMLSRYFHLYYTVIRHPPIQLSSYDRFLKQSGGLSSMLLTMLKKC